MPLEAFLERYVVVSLGTFPYIAHLHAIIQLGVDCSSIYLIFSSPLLDTLVQEFFL